VPLIPANMGEVYCTTLLTRAGVVPPPLMRPSWVPSVQGIWVLMLFAENWALTPFAQ
jgi:hypothetical protein